MFGDSTLIVDSFIFLLLSDIKIIINLVYKYYIGYILTSTSFSFFYREYFIFEVSQSSCLDKLISFVVFFLLSNFFFLITLLRRPQYFLLYWFTFTHHLDFTFTRTSSLLLSFGSFYFHRIGYWYNLVHHLWFKWFYLLIFLSSSPCVLSSRVAYSFYLYVFSTSTRLYLSLQHLWFGSSQAAYP